MTPILYAASSSAAVLQIYSDEPYFRGCERVLRTPARGVSGEVCPEHGIRCHHSSAGATYTYRDAKRNIVASPDLFERCVLRNPFKYESHRFGFEKSEDAVSWNVFRSLQEAGMLGKVGELLTGERAPIEPHLYLWGLDLTDDGFDPWHLLVAARERFESALPVDRPKTEPDIALHVPGRYLVLIEAKFTSSNTFYQRGPRKDGKSLTLDELLSIYDDSQLEILDRNQAARAERVFYQLWRNMVFAEWMAKLDHPRTKAFHVNLVRKGTEHSSAAEFHGMVTDGHKERFRQVTWEAIYAAAVGDRRLSLLSRYFETKSAGLRKAFRLP
jgi:hypothetical protein